MGENGAAIGFWGSVRGTAVQPPRSIQKKRNGKHAKTADHYRCVIHDVSRDTSWRHGIRIRISADIGRKDRNQNTARCPRDRRENGAPRGQYELLFLCGRYTRGRFQEGVQRLEEWLKANAQWVADGEPSAVYWNGPLTLFFLKRSEVHIPVRKVAAP
jgi:hypothetical protein